MSVWENMNIWKSYINSKILGNTHIIFLVGKLKPWKEIRGISSREVHRFMWKNYMAFACYVIKFNWSIYLFVFHFSSLANSILNHLQNIVEQRWSRCKWCGSWDAIGRRVVDEANILFAFKWIFVYWQT